MLTAIIHGEHLTLEQAEWKGASPNLLEKLEAATADAIQTVSGSDPAPELTVGQYVASELGGRVLTYEPEDDDIEGRIY